MKAMVQVDNQKKKKASGNLSKFLYCLDSEQ